MNINDSIEEIHKFDKDLPVLPDTNLHKALTSSIISLECWNKFREILDEALVNEEGKYADNISVKDLKEIVDAFISELENEDKK